MQNIQQLLNSDSAANTIIMISGADLKQLIDETNAYTRQCIEDKYDPKYYDASDLMKMFNIGRTTLYNWINKGKLPKPMHFKEVDNSGKPDKLMWAKNQIRQWEQEHRVGKYSHL